MRSGLRPLALRLALSRAATDIVLQQPTRLGVDANPPHTHYPSADRLEAW